MSAVAHKGNWDEFARLNAERLPPLGDQCISEMMRYIGAPKAMGVADVKHAHVPPPPLASDNDDPDKWRRDPAYIDNITQAFYDPELHDFWVAHTDGSEIHLELSKLSRGPVLYYYQNPSNGKVYPTIFGDQTTPNISWCARESREAVVNAHILKEIAGLILRLIPFKTGIGRQPRTPKTPTPRLTSGQLGRVIGWGEGQSAAALAKTEAATQRLTTQLIRQMVSRGLTRQWVEGQLALYEKAVATAGQKLVNKQLLLRLALMKQLLELWPEP